ncbi:transporter substrate-binding domain-containing protein [Terasakiella sp. SH-1]|uniref:transporter substrate-binding domain-containing protein n=1 Tax=Terasakiella sp. SH-1 TaxID=2560057 RepID=UPI001072F13E|nr:transporter substrate-binding domain-containing protein [Terasakiella sp. SH-1]
MLSSAHRITSIIMLSFFAACITTVPTQAQDKPETVIKIATTGDNFYFHTLLTEVMEKSGYKFKLLRQPFKRSIWALSQKELHMIGPYSSALLVDYAVASNLPLENIRKLPFVIDKSPMFALSTKQMDMQKELKNNTNLKIGYLIYNSFTRPLPGQRLVRAKNLDQLVKLIKIGRIDLAFVSKSNLDYILSKYKHTPFQTSKNPIYFEETYMYINRAHQKLRTTMTKTYQAFSKTAYFKQLNSGSSTEHSWK